MKKNVLKELLNRLEVKSPNVEVLVKVKIPIVLFVVLFVIFLSFTYG